MWGVKWHIVQKMTIDAPGYKTKEKDGSDDKEGSAKIKSKKTLSQLLQEQIESNNLAK